MAYKEIAIIGTFFVWILGFAMNAVMTKLALGWKWFPIYSAVVAVLAALLLLVPALLGVFDS